ncbi:SLC13 family permease [Thermogladius sp. 4427co]|uniref:SLC13 family permease n=1 Tax=Thermogladius sp. 4427co TaxID=3450718 RepID=UPI003F7B202A
MVPTDNASKAVLVSAVIMMLSFAAMALIKIPYEGVGKSIIDSWCSVRAGCSDAATINSWRSIVEQGASLGFFLTVIALTVISMDYRYYASLLGVSALVFLGVISPQLIIGGVEWDLILFLIGTMALAYILRSFRVFEYLAIKVLEASRGRPVILVALLSLLSWFLSLAVGEVASITYVAMLIFDIYRLTNVDIKPLIILSVLATNTGSVALPVGNPIGIYLAFTANLSVSAFILRALPLSLLNLAVLIVLFPLLARNYLSEFEGRLSQDKISKLAAAFYTSLSGREYHRVRGGLVLLLVFLVLVGVNDQLAGLVSKLGGIQVGSHALLAFTPYLIIVVSGTLFGASKMGEALEKGVEWPSIIFFIALFMLGYSLLWSGTASKLAYLTVLTSSWSGYVSFPLLYSILLILSAALSSVLDNLSVIVALTPVAQTIVSIGGATAAYWALLYGGVFGGNYTPIGSSANIVAVGLAEKNRIRIGWGEWLKIALVATSVEILVAIAWTLTVAVS